jgi:hypothetical protein
MIRTNSFFGTRSNGGIGGRGRKYGGVATRHRRRVAGVCARSRHSLQGRIEGSNPFLWIDEMADRAGRVKHGEIIVAPVVGRGMQSVPNGLIHDWIGAVFIPNATIESLLNVPHDYGRYKDICKPVATRGHSKPAEPSKSSPCYGRDTCFS